MPTLRIENFRNGEWMLRGEGEVPATTTIEQIKDNADRSARQPTLTRESAIDAIMAMFDPEGFDRGNAEMCLAGLREAGFAVVPAGDGIAGDVTDDDAA